MYAFPSLHYRFTPAFKALDGQAAPKADLLDRIFRRAEFATRFAALVAQEPATLAAKDIVAVRPRGAATVATVEADAVAVGSELARAVAEVPAVRRVQVFEVRASTVLEEYVRRNGAKGTLVFAFWEEAVDAEAVDAEAVARAVDESGKVVELATFRTGKMYGAWE